MGRRKLLFITGSRGEYGYVRPIIKSLQTSQIMDYGLVVTDMHLLYTFGESINDIRNDKFKIDATIYNTFDGYNEITSSKSLAVFMLQIPEVIVSSKPDILVIAGDRGVQLMAAIAACQLSIPVAHIQAGELSGHIDGYSRHAIARFTHLHFAANRESADRLLRSGEQEFRIHLSGAPQLDELLDDGYVTKHEDILAKFTIDGSRPLFIVLFHPTVEEFDIMHFQIENLLASLDLFREQTIFILNNSDAGSQIIRDRILSFRKDYIQVYKNVARNDYLGLLKCASALIGNSSSGVIEAPLYCLPAINIGDRQKSREHGENVIQAGYEIHGISSAIRLATSFEFRKKLKPVSPYGDGKSSERIVRVLSETPLDERLLRKEFFV